MRNNFLLLTILVLFALSKTTAQECLPDGIKFISQGQIDSFPINHPGCIQIIGDISIRESHSETITNLDGLSQITSIRGSLKVSRNSYLKNLNGLKNLKSIGGNLDLSQNHSLMNLKGLENLIFIGEHVNMSYNKSLTSLSGLDNIISVHSNLSIRSNDALLSLKGLEKLDSIKGDFRIISNNLLPNLIGVNNLNSIGGNLTIFTNESLTNLTGLENLTAIGGCLTVKKNVYLASLSGLDNLTSIIEFLDIYANNSLDNLNALEQLTSIGTYLKVQNNASLSSLNGLENMVTIGGYMDVYDNPSLISMNELEHLSPEGERIKRNTEKKGTYNAWVTSFDRSANYKGYLRSVGDSVFVLSNNSNNLMPNYLTRNIDIKNIEIIKFKQRGKTGKSVLYGALVGGGFGAAIGFTLGKKDCSEDHFCLTRGATATLIGIPMGIAGAVIGGIIGSGKIKIPINGNYKSAKYQKGELLKYRKLEYHN